MPAKLYVVPASHPCATVERALEIKGIPFKKINLVPVFHKGHQKARFGGSGTVPGIVFEDGTKVLGSKAILRALESTPPRPAGEFARRVFPDYPGHVPAGALPPAWLPAATAAA